MKSRYGNSFRKIWLALAVWLLMANILPGLTGKVEQREFSSAAFATVTSESGIRGGHAATVSSVAVTGTAIVTGPKELRDALTEGTYSEITVKNDIVWDLPDIRIDVEEPVTVQMGNNSLHVTTPGPLSIKGPVRFEGSGQGTMIHVEGTFRFVGGEIYGRGDGITALRINRNNSENTHFDIEDSSVAVEGNDSIAIDIKGFETAEIIKACIRASGENSTAVAADGHMRLILCYISGEGRSIAAPYVTLDACLSQPVPLNALIVERETFPGNRIEQNGVSVSWENAEEQFKDALSDLGDSEYYMMVDKNGAENSVIFSVTAQWVKLPSSLDRPGSYAAVRRPVTPEWFPLNLGEYTVPVHVVEADVPFIMSADDAGDGAYLRFFNKISDADSVKLSYKKEGWSRWQDAADLSDTEITETSAYVGKLDINNIYYFKLEVKGGNMEGISNTIEFRYYDSFSYNGGGDRDNVGRGDKGDLPDASNDIADDGELPNSVTDNSEEVFDIITSPDSEGNGQHNISVEEDVLRAYLESNPEGLTLIEEGIKVTLPADTVEQEWLSAERKFSADVRMNDDLNFDVRFWADNEEIMCMDDQRMTVYVPFQTEGQPYDGFYCEDKEGNRVSATGYERHSLEFELCCGGSYRIGHLLEDSLTEAYISDTVDGSSKQVYHFGVMQAMTIVAAIVLMAVLMLRKGGAAGDR